MYRKILLVTKHVSANSFNFTNISANKFNGYCLSSSLLRFYSKENIGDSGDAKKVTAAPSLIGQLFPQTSVNTNDQDEIQKQQKRLEEETKDKTKENEKRWRNTKIGFAIFGGTLIVAGGAVVYEMGAPRKDDNGDIIEDEFSNSPILSQYVRRTWKELTFYQKMIKEPSREKLLPDPVPEPYQPPYTLVLEFTDVLVHPSWSYQTGWRFKKRPGVDSFLEAMASTAYEVVIFTTENALMIWPIIEKLDPENNRITYKLFRDSTHFVDGVHIKNLDSLNRNLSKVIVVDWNKQSTKYHPQNTLRIPRWKGNDDDTTLLDLTSLLKTIASTNVEDVRDVLVYYSQFDDPIQAFRDNQRRLMEQLEEQEREAKTQPPPITNRWSKSFLRH